MAKYFWYSASVESGCFADEVEVEAEVGDGIIDENLLTRAKFTSNWYWRNNIDRPLYLVNTTKVLKTN